MISPALTIPAVAALLAAAVLGYAIALTFRRNTWRFTGAIILSLLAFVIIAFPTYFYASAVTDTRLRADFEERREIYRAKTFEEFRSIMLARNGSMLVIPTVLGGLITILAFVFVLSAKRRTAIGWQNVAPK